MFLTKSSPRSVQLRITFYQLWMSRVMYLTVILHWTLSNSFKYCTAFMLPEIIKQNLLVYLQICGRSREETPAPGPAQGSCPQRSFPDRWVSPRSGEDKDRVFDLNDEASFLKEGDLILQIYLYWINTWTLGAESNKLKPKEIHTLLMTPSPNNDWK